MKLFRLKNSLTQQQQKQKNSWLTILGHSHISLVWSMFEFPKHVHMTNLDLATNTDYVIKRTRNIQKSVRILPFHQQLAVLSRKQQQNLITSLELAHAYLPVMIMPISLPRGSSCQDPAGNWTTRRPPDHRKETQTAVVWSCLQFIRSGQNHLARHSERGKKTRRTEEEPGRQHQGMDRPGVQQVPEGSGEQGKMKKTGCKIICGAPTTLEVKGWKMMMI